MSTPKHLSAGLSEKEIHKTVLVCIFLLASLSVLVGLDNLEDIISVALIEQVAKVLRSDNWSKGVIVVHSLYLHEATGNPP
jgi:hypothetical protein